MYLKVNGIEMSCQQGTKWKDLLEKLPDQGRGALGVNVQGKTYSLNEPAVEYAYARTLTYADEEGRRIYERSLQLLFLTAAHRVCPEGRVRIQHSFGQGLYIDITGATTEKLEKIEREMQKKPHSDTHRPISESADRSEYFRSAMH